jgi:hypothetical protein
MNRLARVAVAAAAVAGFASIPGVANADGQPQGCALGSDFQGHQLPQQQTPNGYIGGENCTFVTGTVTDWAGAGSWTLVWGHFVNDPVTNALTFVQDGTVHDSGLPMTSRDGGVPQQIPAGETVHAYIDWQGTNGGTLLVGNAGQPLI